MVKELITLMLGRCGVRGKEEKECQRHIDNSNVHYSKKFKSDEARSEAAKEFKQVNSLQSSTRNNPKDLMSKGPEERFMEEQSARENSTSQKKSRQLRRACKQYSCGSFGCFDHTLLHD